MTMINDLFIYLSSFETRSHEHKSIYSEISVSRTLGDFNQTSRYPWLRDIQSCKVLVIYKTTTHMLCINICFIGNRNFELNIINDLDPFMILTSDPDF